MKQFGPDDWKRRRLVLDDTALRFTCGNCRADVEQWYFACSKCQVYDPVAACAACGSRVRDERIQYSASGPLGGQVTREIEASFCETCGTAATTSRITTKIEELAAGIGTHVQFVPEVGIFTSEHLEILIDATRRDPGAVREIELSQDGMAVRFGEQSSLFCDALDLVTEYDVADFGHETSPTLQVRPGPPYGADQRRTLHVLLARLQRELASPLQAWSTHFRESAAGDLEEREKELVRLLLSWGADHDRAALALFNDILAGAAPGRFITSFRLLELVLHRLFDDEIGRARRDTQVSDEGFRELVAAQTGDLKTRLRRRVEATSRKPLEVLRGLWRVANPGKAFKPQEVYDSIVKFRNRYAHRPDGINELPLPWEEPDFASFEDHLLDLVVALVADRVDFASEDGSGAA